MARKMFSMKEDEHLYNAMVVWIETGKNEKAKFIIDHTDPTDLANENGVTLLHLAALYGNLNVMEHLKEMGCELDVKDSSNRTPLNLAVSNQHWEAAKFLLKYDVDIFAMDSNGETPLSKLISNYKADTEILKTFFDKVKSKSGNKNELLRTLRVYGCRLTNLIHLHDADITEMFLSMPDADDSESISMEFWSVEIAMRSMDEENMRILLHRGENMDSRREKFVFSMRSVLRDSYYDDESLDVVLRVAIKQLVTWKVLNNASILLLEKTYREIPEECLRKMLDDSLESYIQTDYGSDIRLQMFGNGFPGVLEMVKNGEADVNALARKGRTALHIAVQGGAIDTMRYLLESGMSPDITEHNGKTPLFKVHNYEYKCAECLELLLSYKADLQAADNLGRTYIDCYPSPEFSHDVIKIVIAHLAILELTGVPLKESFRTYIFASEDTLNYFLSCCLQLERMKTLQVHSSLTLFEVLTENLKNLIRRVRSIDHETVDTFFSSGSVKEFDSYYVLSSTRLLHWAVHMGDMRDEAAVVISENIEVLKPYDLVIEKICSFLSYYDLRAFE